MSTKTVEVNEEVIKYWLCTLEEWKTLDTSGKYSTLMLEMSPKMTELTGLLSEMEKVLTDVEPRQVLLQYPSAPKLLHALLNNVLVQTADDLYHLTLRCVTAVSVSSSNNEQQVDEITKKSVKWVKSQMKNVCSLTPPMIKCFTAVSEHVSVQAFELTEEINNQLVTSLVKDLSNLPSCEWKDSCGDFHPQCPVQGSLIRQVSEMCLPIVLSQAARPLMEVLLTCDVESNVISKSNSESEDTLQVGEALSPYFLEALRETPKNWCRDVANGTPLSDDARVALWMRQCSHFEDEVIDLIEVCCREKMFMSRQEMKKIVSLRELPRALCDNISLWAIAVGILQCVIHQTKGNLLVMKFVGALLQCVNKFQRKHNMLENPLSHASYANIWSLQLAELTSLLNIDWTDLPATAFRYHTKKVQHCITEICQQQRCDSYYVWLILQGFPDLLQKCYWSVIVENEQFVDSSLAIQFYYHGGGALLDNIVKSKIKDFVYRLHILKNKCQVTTSDILCASNSIADVVSGHKNIASLIRNLIMVFILTNSSTQNLNFQDIFSKLTKEISAAHALDFLLDWLEETFGILDQGGFRWPYEEHHFMNKSEKYLTLLQTTYARFNKWVNQLSYNTPLNKTDLDSRFKTVCKFLTKTT